jgi:hypothetical protein
LFFSLPVNHLDESWSPSFQRLVAACSGFGLSSRPYAIPGRRLFVLLDLLDVLLQFTDGVGRAPEWEDAMETLIAEEDGSA